MSKKVSYAELEKTVNELNAQINASEAHGLLTGMLCLARRPVAEAEWRTALAENLDCAVPTAKQWTIFSKLIKQLTEDFTTNNFAFNLLLPADDSELEERLIALGFWCRGYLSGLGLVGITGEDLKNDIVKELIHDLSQIAHVNMDTDASEEDEYNYTELVEYVRIAVQNIKLELQDADQQQIIH